MTATVPIRQHIQQLSLDAKVELFELDLSPVTRTNTAEDHFYFHAGTNELGSPVVWQGIAYQPFAVLVEGFERTTKGQSPRPRLRVANIQGSISALTQEFDDLVGAKLIRRVTYARYLDEVNFPNRVNLVNNTESIHTFTNSGLSSITANVTFSPYGELTATKIAESSANETHYVQFLSVSSLTNGSLVTAAISGVPAGRRRVQVQFGGAAFSSVKSATVDLLTGAIVASVSLGVDDYVTVEQQSAGYVRVHLTARTTATGIARVRVFTVVSTGNSFLGDGVSGLILSAPQISVGGPTKYEPIGATWARNAEADPDQHMPDEVFFVERKPSENPAVVEFELVSPMDMEGFMLPGRDVTAYTCTSQYRGPECGYTGSLYFNAADQPVYTLAEDVCSQARSGCKKRFGTGYLPFGGFPAVRVYRS